MNFQLVERNGSGSTETWEPNEGDAEVFCWRLEQLELAGYSGALAALLAEESRVDLHLACDLVAAGCPERTAYRILA